MLDRDLEPPAYNEDDDIKFVCNQLGIDWADYDEDGITRMAFSSMEDLEEYIAENRLRDNDEEE